jgi:hypothetical protein
MNSSMKWKSSEEPAKAEMLLPATRYFTDPSSVQHSSTFPKLCLNNMKCPDTVMKKAIDVAFDKTVLFALLHNVIR